MSNRPSVVKTDLRGRQAAACVVKEKLWKDRQVLRVFFMKPGSEVLEGWKCEGKEMTTEMIMEWAGAWQQAPSAPQFEVAERVVRADIRVKFSVTEPCSSLVGMEAASTARDDSTMTLNLSSKDDPKFKVIEMFGRALGLEDQKQSAESQDGDHWNKGTFDLCIKKLEEAYKKNDPK